MADAEGDDSDGGRASGCAHASDEEVPARPCAMVRCVPAGTACRLVCAPRGVQGAAADEMVGSLAGRRCDRASLIAHCHNYGHDQSAAEFGHNVAVSDWLHPTWRTCHQRRVQNPQYGRMWPVMFISHEHEIRSLREASTAGLIPQSGCRNCDSNAGKHGGHMVAHIHDQRHL